MLRCGFLRLPVLLLVCFAASAAAQEDRSRSQRMRAVVGLATTRPEIDAIVWANGTATSCSRPARAPMNVARRSASGPASGSYVTSLPR